jgi:hypothetical protein
MRLTKAGSSRCTTTGSGFNQGCVIGRLPAERRAVLLVRTKPRPNKHILNLSERWDRSVAFLPRVRAAKLTTYASYW